MQTIAIVSKQPTVISFSFLVANNIETKKEDDVHPLFRYMLFYELTVQSLLSF
jgi:hypothetical protein